MAPEWVAICHLSGARTWEEKKRFRMDEIWVMTVATREVNRTSWVWYNTLSMDAGILFLSEIFLEFTASFNGTFSCCSGGIQITNEIRLTIHQLRSSDSPFDKTHQPIAYFLIIFFHLVFQINRICFIIQFRLSVNTENPISYVDWRRSVGDFQNECQIWQQPNVFTSVSTNMHQLAPLWILPSTLWVELANSNLHNLPLGRPNRNS
jgi:hypothetical protein